MSFIFRRELKMKLVWDKPTKSFRLLGFLSLSFPFLSLSLSLLLLLLYSLSFSIFLFTSIRTFLLDPFPPPSLFLFVHLYFSANFFLFFFSRILTGERKRGKGRRERSDTFSLRRVRFVFHTQFYPLAKWSFFSPLCSSPTSPPSDLPYRLSH